MSGTLDVKLEYFDSSTGIDKWVEVDENTTIFDPDAKYEPGYTEKFHKNIEIMTQNAFNHLMKYT